MTPDELRALAGKLRKLQAGEAYEAADYLRACADAKPVAVPAGWKLVPVDPTPEMLSAVGMMDGYDWHAPGCSPDADHANWYSAMIAAAPAVPQAEPKPTPASGNDLNVYKEMATNYRNDAQAEPKREPLPGLAPTHRCPACGALWRQCDDASWNLRSALCCGLCDAGRVELVRLLDEPKREPLSDDIISYEHACRSSYEPTCAASDFNSFKLGVRFAERAHGIGGSDAE